MQVKKGGVLLKATASPSPVPPHYPGSRGCLSCQHILVAQRQVHVAEAALQDFHRALCCYVDFTGAQSHCLQ